MKRIFFLSGLFLSGVYILCPKDTGPRMQKNMAGFLVANAYVAIPPQEATKTTPQEPLLAEDSYGLDTQLLLGESIKLIRSYRTSQGDAWAEIALLEQPTYRAGKWQPKICFIRDHACSLRLKEWKPNAHAIAMLAVLYARPTAASIRLGYLSMGTAVHVIKEAGHGWVKVLLASGLMGYMLVTDLLTTSAVRAKTLMQKRELALGAAKQFENTPYRWGCASGYDASSSGLTGVDCSGLVFLSYRALGMKVPRDAHDQFQASFPIKRGSDLLPGDLVFLAKLDASEKNMRVHHVMMVVGSDLLIEATGLRCRSLSDWNALSPLLRKEARVRIISADKYFSKISLQKIEYGQVTEKGDIVFLGTFFGDRSTRESLLRGLI